MTVSLASASYTHLDVYKRQIIYESRETSGENKIHAEVSELADEQDEGSCDYCNRVGSVSYTHLDVYKRQEQD